MKTRRLASIGLLLLVGIGVGCTLRFDVSAGKGTGSADPILPDPGGESGDTPVLDAAQQARKEEAERYTLDVIYQGATLAESVRLPSGDIVDFMDRNTMQALPLGLPALPFGPEAFVLPPGFSFGLTELEQDPALLQVAASATPFVRPGFWPYILGEAPDAVSIEDYLDRYQEGGSPDIATRLYAALQSNEPNRGLSGYLSQFRPEVVAQSFSLIEFAVACPAVGPVQEMVGIVISVDRYNKFGSNRQKYNDGEPRMHIEYARVVNGKAKYVWDGRDGTFVNNPLRLHHPGQKVPVSVLDKPPVEHLMAIFQAPTGDWWIAYDGDLLGYYPATLFSTLNGGGCRSAWYGEIMNKTKDATIQTEMGSGQFAEAGLLKAAHVRNPLYYDLWWNGLTPKDGPSGASYEPLCYSRSALTYLPEPWASYFLFISGPGGKNPTCKWP